MKKLTKKIKWENVFALVWGALSIYAMYTHIRLNGLYIGLLLEIVMYGVSIVGIRYIIKDIRVNPSNWLFEE